MQEDQRCAAKGLALAAAEPRLLSLLSTHLWFTEIAQKLSLCEHRQVGGEIDLPEARSLFAEPGARRSRTSALEG
jgi:hypothetical protein